MHGVVFYNPPTSHFIANVGARRAQGRDGVASNCPEEDTTSARLRLWQATACSKLHFNITSGKEPIGKMEENGATSSFPVEIPLSAPPRQTTSCYMVNSATYASAEAKETEDVIPTDHADNALASLTTPVLGIDEPYNMLKEIRKKKLQICRHQQWECNRMLQQQSTLLASREQV